MNNFQESERVSQSLHSISSQGYLLFPPLLLGTLHIPSLQGGCELTDIKGFFFGGGGGVSLTMVKHTMSGEPQFNALVNNNCYIN
jgi:hypothetical protein